MIPILLSHGCDISLKDINSSNVFHLIAGQVTDEKEAIRILEVFMEHIKSGVYNPSVLTPAFSAVFFTSFFCIFLSSNLDKKVKNHRTIPELALDRQYLELHSKLQGFSDRVLTYVQKITDPACKFKVIYCDFIIPNINDDYPRWTTFARKFNSFPDHSNYFSSTLLFNI